MTHSAEALLQAIREHHEAVKAQACCGPDLWHDPAWETDRMLWAAAGIADSAEETADE